MSFGKLLNKVAAATSKNSFSIGATGLSILLERNCFVGET